jgi:hypothetical protein
MANETKEETKKETRRVVYIGGHYGPVAIFGAGIGPCRVGDGPCDIDREVVDPLVEAKVFRDATPEDELHETAMGNLTTAKEKEMVAAADTLIDGAAGGGKVLDFGGSFAPVQDSIDRHD